MLRASIPGAGVPERARPREKNRGCARASSRVRDGEFGFGCRLAKRRPSACRTASALARKKSCWSGAAPGNSRARIDSREPERGPARHQALKAAGQDAHDLHGLIIDVNGAADHAGDRPPNASANTRNCPPRPARAPGWASRASRRRPLERDDPEAAEIVGRNQHGAQTGIAIHHHIQSSCPRRPASRTSGFAVR